MERALKPPFREIVIATRNQGKLKEIKKIMAKLPVKILSLLDFPDMPEIVEDGATYYENAAKKARVVAKETGKPALADDSGLEVEFLDGAPGVHSARYGGAKLSDGERNALLLEQLKEVPSDKRRARFRCVMVLVWPHGMEQAFEGACSGWIAETPTGEGGFGYDPVFYLPQYGKTMAEVGLQLKNQISHRAKALSAVKEALKKLDI